jgi:hypothetical protein
MEDLISENSAEVLDILEQLESVNAMIDIHSDDDFMKVQYERRKKELTGKLSEKLSALKIDIRDLAA